MERSELLNEIARQLEVNEETVESVLKAVFERLGAEEGKPAAVEVPPYFDRYVTAEISHLREDMSKGFADVDEQFKQLREEMNRRFAQVDRRFEESKEETDRRFTDVNRRFDRLERRFFALGIPVVVGILAIIFKVFFGG